MRKIKSEKQVYIESLIPEDSLKIQAREYYQSLNKDGISLSSVEGSLLKVLLKSVAARKVVEIGTLTGLSALYLHEGLCADGQIWTVEKDEAHYQLAQKVFAGANQQANGQSNEHKKITALHGDAREVLKSISSEAPFCAVFIDANKAAYLDYLNWAEDLVRPGGLIIADNVFLSGAVFENGSHEGTAFSVKQVQVMREFNQRLMSSAKWTSTLVPTDEGLLVAVRNESTSEIKNL